MTSSSIFWEFHRKQKDCEIVRCVKTVADWPAQFFKSVSYLVQSWRALRLNGGRWYRKIKSVGRCRSESARPRESIRTIIDCYWPNMLWHENVRAHRYLSWQLRKRVTSASFEGASQFSWTVRKPRQYDRTFLANITLDQLFLTQNVVEKGLTKGD